MGSQFQQMILFLIIHSNHTHFKFVCHIDERPNAIDLKILRQKRMSQKFKILLVSHTILFDLSTKLVNLKLTWACTIIWPGDSILPHNQKVKKKRGGLAHFLCIIMIYVI